MIINLIGAIGTARLPPLQTINDAGCRPWAGLCDNKVARAVQMGCRCCTALARSLARHSELARVARADSCGQVAAGSVSCPRLQLRRPTLPEAAPAGRPTLSPTSPTVRVCNIGWLAGLEFPAN